MAHPMQWLSLALYAASFACYARILYAPHKWLGRLGTLLLAAAIAAHYFALLERSRLTHTVPYDDLYGSMSLFAWLLGVTYLGLELLHRQRGVGAVITALLVAWMAGLEIFAPGSTTPRPPASGALFAFHVTLNTWAYAAFALSFVLSLVYLVQDGLLRSRRLGAAFWRFPPLDLLERMARGGVWVGLAALCCGVAIGFVWEHRLSGGFAWADPKVVITLGILGVYAAYLVLSRRSGWRGSRAALVCALNFLVVLFSYTVVNLYMTQFHRFF
jgi:ABC-type transport system involved in cytochrome c biogenesis permease subunit